MSSLQSKKVLYTSDDGVTFTTVQDYLEQLRGDLDALETLVDATGFISPAGFTSTDLQAAIDAAFTAGGANVVCSPGTYTFTATVNMKANVTVSGTPGVTYTQGTAANLDPLFDFHTNTANFAAIIGGIVDGNRTNNTDNDSVNLIYVGDANDVTIRPDKMINAPGRGVLIQNGLRPNVSGIKLISNIRCLGIAAAATAGNNATNGRFDDNTYESPVGQHGIYLQWVDRCSVSRNKITGARATGVCDTSGTTVTYVSGTNFASISAGEFIVINAVEYHITAKGSNTSLTVSPSAGTQSGKAFVAGPGDLINVGNCSYTKADNNICFNGAAGHVVFHNFYGGVSALHNSCIGTKSAGAGQAGVAVAGTDTVAPDTIINGTVIKDTEIIESGKGNGANSSVSNCGISVLEFGTASIGEVTIDGAYMKDYGGPTTMDYPIILSNMAAGQVYVGNVLAKGTTNALILGGISISLSGGWGTTASVVTNFYDGESLKCTISSAGTGQGANPTVTLTRRALPLNGGNIGIAKAINNSSGAAIAVFGDQVGSSSETLTFVFTPVAGTDYVLWMLH